MLWLKSARDDWPADISTRCSTYEDFYCREKLTYVPYCPCSR